MQYLPALHGGPMLIGDAWTTWTHAGVAYVRHDGGVQAHDVLTHRLVETPDALVDPRRPRGRWVPGVSAEPSA